MSSSLSFFFFFNDTATTEIYTLSLHDALPISVAQRTTGEIIGKVVDESGSVLPGVTVTLRGRTRSEEHTSELQSLTNLVCRLLLEKKKKKKIHHTYIRKKIIQKQVDKALNTAR